MHLQLDEERALLQDTVRGFAKEQVRPHARTWEEKGAIDGAVLDQAWQLGFATLGVGPTFGGAADKDDAVPSALSNALVLEQLAWADLGFALAACSPLHVTVPLALVGQEGLKREVLPGVLGSTSLPRATGAWVEAGRTYDVRAMATRSTPSAQGPVLSGKKTLVPRGDDSEITVVLAKTRGADEPAAFEPFVLLGKNVPGLSRGKRCDVIGPRAVPLVELSFDEASARPLAHKSGVAHAQLLERALVGSAAASLGVARAAVEYAVDYARERRAFGRAIAQNQSIAFMLAEGAMDVEALRWLVWKAAWKVDRDHPKGESALAEASRAARFGADLAFRVSDACVQILGGHGVIRDHLAELFFRNSRTLAATPGWFMV
ncbi:MAG: acyl-CoA dehydrogenase family protein [Deltaproteobacteria bacterium]|nr:acyl-CoA dehydrogenase family protein [Deltaproteobacteria bacterium]